MKKDKNKVHKNKIIFVTLIIFLSVWLELFFLNTFLADLYLKKGKDSVAKNNYSLALANFNKAITYNSKEASYYKNRAQCYAQISFLLNDSPEKSVYKELALGDLEYAYNLNPKNLKFVRDSFYVYSLLALKEPADSKIVLISKDVFVKNKQIYNTDLGTLVDIGVYEKRLNWFEDYEVTQSLIKKLRPDVLKWYPNLIN